MTGSLVSLPGSASPARFPVTGLSMAGPKLDGAGVQKLKTLEDATTMLHRIHGLVETYALAVKKSHPTAHYIQQIRRALPPLIGLLKGQFGMIADQVAALNLLAT